MAKGNEAYLPAAELSLFCEQVGMILSAGIPLFDGMETLARSYKDERYGDRFIELYMSLVNSGELGTALEQSGMFPPYMVAMVRIGERTGKLDEVMEALAGYYQSEDTLRASIKNAVVYPTVLLLMLSVVIGILVVSVLPVFTRVFNSLGLSAADSQSSIMQIGMWIGYGVLILVGVFLLVLLTIWVLLKTKKRENVLDWLGSKLSFLRNAREKIAAGRFANVLSIMLKSGCDLTTALEVAPEVVEERGYLRKIASCQAELRDGVPFTEALIHGKLFAEIHEKMLTFGAAAGKLDTVMEKLSDIYRTEADDNIGRLVAMIEPTLVTVLTVVIGGILLTVTLPLLSILAALG